MERKNLDEDVVRETMGCILKYQDDINRFSGRSGRTGKNVTNF